MAFDDYSPSGRSALISRIKEIREISEKLAAPLTPEDWMLQSMPEASPVKWNLAHTSWFFETFILKRYVCDYSEFHPKFGYLFNSYYNQIGKMHPRAERGALSRPSAAEVLAYRKHVDGALQKFIECAQADELSGAGGLIDLGLAHEQQHQELLLTDLKHAMSFNPLAPVVYQEKRFDDADTPAMMAWREMPGGLCEIGATDDGFSFDSEGPRHKVYLHPFKMARRPVTNREFISFMEEGGYDNPVHWLADGWDAVQKREWRAPLYWREADGIWLEYTLFGERAVNLDVPVCHVSFFEAAAYASWANARLPTEIEWEAAASLFGPDGRFLENGEPAAPAPGKDADDDLVQLFGDVWEWTASPYVAYPGYAAAAGAVGEYNGKFMSGQMVLRGGSCATPTGHARLSYRNFFAPEARWQFSGFRLARDCN